MASQDLSALARINKYLSHDQKLLLVNSVVKLVALDWMIWMLCIRTLNNSLNHVHEQAVILVHNNYNSFFHDILEMSNEKSLAHLF